MLSDRRPSSSTTSTRTRLTPHVGIPAHTPDSNITSHLLCSHCTASGQHYARLVKFRGRAFSIGGLLCLNSPPAAKNTSGKRYEGCRSVCDNRCAKRFCSVGLEADMVDSSSCPPEGGRYIEQKKYFARARRRTHRSFTK